MKKNLLILLLCFTGSASAQMRTFTVTYDNIPACNTQFTVENSNGKKLGSGKSDNWGTFSCDCDLDNGEDFILVADPEKGKGWTLDIPIELIEVHGLRYVIEIENIEAIVSEAFEQQKGMVDDAEEINAGMNERSGSSETGVKEIGIIRGVVKAGEVIGESQFKIIKVSIGRSCLEELKSDEKGNETTPEATSNPVNAENASSGNAEVKTEAVKTEEVKKEPELSKKEQKALEEEQERKAKEAEKEAERLKKEQEEAERLEQERIEAEEEAAAEDLNFTPEEFGQMSNFDLNKKQAWCETAIGRNNMKLKTRGALLKQDEKAAIENRIKELEAGVEAIKAELARREAEENAKKAAKEAEKTEK